MKFRHSKETIIYVLNVDILFLKLQCNITTNEQNHPKSFLYKRDQKLVNHIKCRQTEFLTDFYLHRDKAPMKQCTQNSLVVVAHTLVQYQSRVSQVQFYTVHISSYNFQHLLLLKNQTSPISNLFISFLLCFSFLCTFWGSNGICN